MAAHTLFCRCRQSPVRRAADPAATSAGPDAGGFCGARAATGSRSLSACTSTLLTPGSSSNNSNCAAESFSLPGPYFSISCRRNRSSSTWIFSSAYCSRCSVVASCCLSCSTNSASEGEAGVEAAEGFEVSTHDELCSSRGELWKTIILCSIYAVERTFLSNLLDTMAGAASGPDRFRLTARQVLRDSAPPLPCASPACGQRKRPFSKRFAHTHSPLPSKTKSFRRLCRPLQKRKTWPLKGSHCKRSRTNPNRPSNPLRMSVAPTAR